MKTSMWQPCGKFLPGITSLVMMLVVAGLAGAAGGGSADMSDLRGLEGIDPRRGFTLPWDKAGVGDVYWIASWVYYVP